LKWQAPSFHAWFASDDLFYMQNFDLDMGDTGKRFYSPTPNLDEKRTLADILGYLFYAPCVGFSGPRFDEKITLKKMNILLVMPEVSDLLRNGMREMYELERTGGCSDVSRIVVPHRE